MSRRATVLIAALAATVLCLGSYTVAMANAPRPASVTTTQGIGACSTSSGYLRLVDSSARCPAGYAKVSLAQATNIPRATSISLTDNGSQTKTLALPGHTSVGVHCDGLGYSTFRLLIKHTGSSIVMRGGVYVDLNGSAVVNEHAKDFDTTLEPGTNTFGTNSDVELSSSPQPGDSATVDLHVQIVVAGYRYLLTAYLQAYKYDCDAFVHVEIA